MVLQLLLRRKAGSLQCRDWQNLLNLESHLDDFRSSNTKNDNGLTIYATIEVMSQAACTYSGSGEPLSLIQALIARVLVNTLTLCTPTFDPLGLCLCVQAALLNHSCSPNTAITFSGATLSVRSLVPISAGTELTIAYIDTSTALKTRQSELQSRYFFTCACSACITNSTDSIPDLPSDSVFDALSVRAMAIQESASHQPPHLAATQLIDALSLLKVYPPYRQPYPAILHTAFLNAVARGAWPAALKFSLSAYFNIDPVHYQPDWHPVRIARKWVLLRLLVQIAQLLSDGDESVDSLKASGIKWQIVAVGLLGEIVSGLELSHGKDNKFRAEVVAFADELGLGGIKLGEDVFSTQKGPLRSLADGL